MLPTILMVIGLFIVIIGLAITFMSVVSSIFAKDANGEDSFLFFDDDDF